MKCDYCGKFCVPYDSFTPFGCASYDPPEPYDPSYFCKNCYTKNYWKWYYGFKRGSRHGDWIKSLAESRAAKRLKLKWIHDVGLIDLRIPREIHYEYIKESEGEHYVPYVGNSHLLKNYKSTPFTLNV